MTEAVVIDEDECLVDTERTEHDDCEEENKHDLLSGIEGGSYDE